MQWMVYFVVIFSQNHLFKAVDSFKATYDQAKPYTLAPPGSDSAKQLQTSGDSNTWHPVLEWKVFLNANNKHNGYFAAPYFDSRVSKRADGNTFSYVDRSADQKWLEEVFEKLNIRLFPLREENIISFERRLNNSKEYFPVVFTREVEVESNSFKETFVNQIKKVCTEAGLCFRNVSVHSKTSNSDGNIAESIVLDHIGATVPLIKNTTEILKLEAYEEGNYTLMLPKEQKNNDVVIIEINNINFRVSQNSKILIRNQGVTENNASLSPTTDDAIDLNVTQVENSESLPITEQIMTMPIDAEIEKAITESMLDTETTDAYEIGKETIMHPTEYYNKTIFPTSEISENHTPDTKGVTDDRDIGINNNTDSFDNIQDETISPITSISTDRRPRFTDDSNTNLHSIDLGPYEVRQLNSSEQPLVAVIRIFLKNSGLKDSIDDNQTLSDAKYTANANYKTTDAEPQLKRSKRHVGGYLFKTEYQKPSEKFSRNESAFNLSVPLNNNPRKESKLNPSKGASTPVESLNYEAVILTNENRGHGSNPSEPFLLQQENDSYSSEAIPKSNEVLNQAAMRALGNKGLITNEISSSAGGVDGTKSNQTASGDREAVVPLLIPQKWSPGGNDSKKSELQMAAQKTEVPSRGKYSGKTDIKTGKICDLKDGCLEANGVFPPTKVNRPRYREGDGGMTVNDTINVEVLNKREERGSRSKKRRRSLQQVLRNGNAIKSPAATKNIKVLKYNPVTLLAPGKSNSSTSNFSNASQNYNDSTPDETDEQERDQRKNQQPKDDSFMKKIFHRRLLSVIPRNSVLHRKKRSWINTPLILNPNCVVYLIQIREPPRRHLPMQQSPTFPSNKNGLKNYPNWDLNRPPQPHIERPPYTKSTRPMSERPIITQGGLQADRDLSTNHGNTMPPRRWPPATEANRTPNPLPFDTQMVNRKPLAPEREREDDKWEKNWVLVNPETTNEFTTVRNTLFPPTSSVPSVGNRYPQTPETADGSWTSNWKYDPWKIVRYPWQVIKPLPLMPGVD